MPGSGRKRIGPGGQQPIRDEDARIAGSRIEDARIFNRRLVFETIFQRAPISRVEIANIVGLKPQTISSITRELLEQGLISEAGRSSGLRGQPQIYLEPNADAGFSVGIHVDRNHCQLMICDLKRSARARMEISCNTRDPDETVARMAEGIAQALAENAIPRHKVWGIGLVLPTFGSDVYDFDFSMQHWEAWRDTPFVENLQSLCGLQVLVENDATAAAIGERIHRSGAQDATFVYFYIGHGTGAGLIIDGYPFKGVGGNAGELGLLPIAGLDGSPVWPETGAKDILSLAGLAHACGMTAETVDSDELNRLCAVRDHRLMNWVASAAAVVRDASAIIEVMFDPGFIAVGGALPRAIVEMLVDRAYPLRSTPAARRDRTFPRLMPAILIHDAAVTGAAMLPIFVNTSHNFRHLYFRQVLGDERPFDGASPV